MSTQQIDVNFRKTFKLNLPDLELRELISLPIITKQLINIKISRLRTDKDSIHQWSRIGEGTYFLHWGKIGKIPIKIFGN